MECYYSNIKSMIVLLAGGSMTASPPEEPSGWEADPAWLDRDPMTAAEREAWLDRLCAQDDDPADAPQEYWDPESCAPPPGQDELTADELAGIAAGGQPMRCSRWTPPARGGAARGRPGSARVFPGRVGEPGSRVRHRDGVGCDAGLRPAGGGRRRRGRTPAAIRVTRSAGWLIMSWSGWCAPLTGSRRTWPPASWWPSRRCSGGTPRTGSSRSPGRCPPWCTSSPGTSWPSRWASPGPRRTGC